MTYKKIFLILVATFLVLGIGCSQKTGIKGTLILQVGQTGDVRNSSVRLFKATDFTVTPLKEVKSDATGVDQTVSDFEFTDVIEDNYYLFAWKDLNGNGEIDNLDIVGVHGGTYTPGEGGSVVTVIKGKMTDVGNITMYIYKELILTTRYESDANGYLSFIYKFNDDCSVSTWQLTVPDGQTVPDNTQAGDKTANTEYRSEWWNYGGGAMPPGTYIITIGGNWNNSNFTVADTFNVAK